MIIDKKVNQKFIIGDAISDKELDKLLLFYKELEEALACLGETYHFAWCDVFHKYNKLKSYKANR